MRDDKEILKPMSVARVEFINDLTDLINKTMLPPFIMEAVLKDFYNDIHMIAQKQYKDDLNKYTEQLSKEQTP